jgi:hypothetical protein
MEPLVAERERRFASVSATQHGTNATRPAGTAEALARDMDAASPIGEVHEALLRDAGFREVGLIWRTLDDGILVGVR